MFRTLFKFTKFLVMLPETIVVCGVSGSGKSTVGAKLSEMIGWRFKDGDDLHFSGSIAKMTRGESLDDTDRLPWLDTIVNFVERNNRTVVACSALKKVYRDILRKKLNCRFVLLDVERNVIEERLVGRRDHFMPVSLLDSQLLTLERPTVEETDMHVIHITSRTDSVIEVSKRIKTVLGE